VSSGRGRVFTWLCVLFDWGTKKNRVVCLLALVYCRACLFTLLLVLHPALLALCFVFLP
jgi:hypothetical protein